MLSQDESITFVNHPLSAATEHLHETVELLVLDARRRGMSNPKKAARLRRIALGLACVGAALDRIGRADAEARS